MESKSINIFSQRHHKEIIARQLGVSISKDYTKVICNLMEKYNQEYYDYGEYFNFIEMTFKELLIYQWEGKQYKGKLVKDMILQEFLLQDYPSSTLDAIEVFYFISHSEDFLADINNLFVNNDLPFKLVKGKIEIIIPEKIPKGNTQTMEKIKKDIDNNILKGEYLLVLDRLHTYVGFLLKMYCSLLGINIVKDNSEQINYSKTVREIVDLLFSEDLVNNFEKATINATTNVLNEFNSIRNNNSAAHENDNMLSNDKAKYVVQIITASFNLLDSRVYDYLFEGAENF